MTTAKRGKTATASPITERRKVERVDGWKDSNGKVWDNIVQAEGVQAALDLRRLVNNELDLADGHGDDETGWEAFENFARKHRDLIIDLMMSAYMRPSEIDQKLDDVARDRVSPPAPFSPNQNDRLRELLKPAFDKGWERRGDREHNDHAPEKDDAFMRWFRASNWEHAIAQAEALFPSIVMQIDGKEEPPLQFFTEFNARFTFEAGFSAAVEASGKSCSTMFKDWWKSVQPKNAVRDAHTSIHADDDDAASGLMPMSKREIMITATPSNGVSMPLDHHAITYKLDRYVQDSVNIPVIGEAVWKAAMNFHRIDGLDLFDPHFFVLVQFKKPQPSLEQQFQALPDMRDVPSPVRQRIETKAEELFEVYRKQHPVKNYDEFEPWSKQSTTERSRFINEARRALMI